MSQEPTLLAEAFQNKPAGDAHDGLAKRHHFVADPWPRQDLGLRPIDPATEKKAMTTDDQDAVARLVKVEARRAGMRVGFRS